MSEQTIPCMQCPIPTACVEVDRCATAEMPPEIKLDLFGDQAKNKADAAVSDEPNPEPAPAPDPAVVWIIMRQWPGGKVEFVSVHRHEETARYAASRLVSADQFWLSLHSKEVQP